MQSWFPYGVGIVVGFVASRVLSALSKRQAAARVEQRALNVISADVDKMTARKTRELLAVTAQLPQVPTASHITGFVIRKAGSTPAQRAIVEMGAVRWLDDAEFWELMHPTRPDAAAFLKAAAEENTRRLHGHCASMVTAEQLGAYLNTSVEDDPTEGWYQTKFDFTKIRSASDTIADLKELVDLTVWQRDTVERAAVWLSGLAEVGDAWWTQFIEYVDTLDAGDNEEVREHLIELVGKVIATPVDAL